MSEAKPRWMDGFRQSTPGGSTAAATYDNDDKGQQPDPPGRWCALALLTVCTVLGMSTWFSATAVLPQLNDKWSLGNDRIRLPSPPPPCLRLSCACPGATRCCTSGWLPVGLRAPGCAANAVAHGLKPCWAPAGGDDGGFLASFEHARL